MTTGWPQDQHDLRWPYAENDETGPGSPVRGRLATDTDPQAAGHPAAGADHPSGPLPVGLMHDPREDRPQRGRLGRKARAERGVGDPDQIGGDADYDWIKYLGEAGPAQESGRRPADPVGRSAEPVRRSAEPAPKPDETSGRGGRPLPQRHASTGTSPAGTSPAGTSPAGTSPAGTSPAGSAPAGPTSWDRPSGAFDQPQHTSTWDRPQHSNSWDAPQHTSSWDRPRHSSSPWDKPEQRGPWATESSWPEAAYPAASAAGQGGAAVRPAWPGAGQDERPARSPSPGRRGRTAEPAPWDREVPADGTGPIEPPTRGRRQPRWSPAEARATDVADRHGAISPPAAAQPRTTGSAGIDAATSLWPSREDLDREIDAAPTERADRRSAKRGRPAKPDRKGKADRPGNAGRKAPRAARASAAGRTGVANAPSLRRPSADQATGVQAPWRASPETSVEVAAKPAAKAATKPSRSRRGQARSLRRRVRLLIAVGVVAVVALAAVVVRGLLATSGPLHTISTPTKLGSFVLEPQLAQGMGAAALRADIVKKGNGEATHVVDAVYEVNSGTAAKSGPVIVLFIGGNLTGSASSFISSFTGLLSGAFVTSPGTLGGQAACVPGYSGHPAECAWADNDTFGLFASPTLSAAALGNELRSLRPLVEHARR